MKENKEEKERERREKEKQEKETLGEASSTQQKGVEAARNKDSDKRGEEDGGESSSSLSDIARSDIDVDDL